MKRKTLRPAHCEPGSLTSAKELGQRLRASRELLASSDLASSGMAWRLWAACVEATYGYAREGDKIYATTLGTAAGIKRQAASELLRRFDELGVFVWEAAPRGSHGISELRLPGYTSLPGDVSGLYTSLPGDVSNVHVPPRGRVEAPTRPSQGTLQSYTSSVLSSKALPIERENLDSMTGEPVETGASTSGESQAGPRPVEEMSRAELERAAFRAVKANDRPYLEAIRAELHRREVSGSALAWFGEPEGES